MTRDGTERPTDDAVGSLLDGPVAALRDAVHRGAASPDAIAEAALSRLSERNPALNAVVDHDAGAVRAEAAALTQRLARGERPPLAGAPMLVKDNIWARGRRITQGSRLFAAHRAARDAIAVDRARAAGALILGVAACSEFACKGVTTTPLHGATRNPWDPALTPGGSSGGSAAALAAAIAPLALGTDAGGSGRRPAAHCGVVGFKPSWGAIPYGPGFDEPFWDISVIAPMARRVADAAALFEALAGPDPADPASLIALAPARDPKSLRIAFAPTLGRDVAIDADAADAAARAVDALATRGFSVTERAPAWPDSAVEGGQEAALMPLQHAGLAALYGARWRAEPALFDPDLGAQIERGLSATAAEVIGALEAGRRLREAVTTFFAEIDLLLCPTTPCAAWPLDRLGPETIGGRPAAPRDHAVFTPQMNVARAPAISIPCGRATDAVGRREGPPLGLQIVGPVGEDRTVLAAAAAAEAIIEVEGLAPGPAPIAAGRPTGDAR